jgi:hypothetical protein
MSPWQRPAATSDINHIIDLSGSRVDATPPIPTIKKQQKRDFGIGFKFLKNKETRN